MKFSTLTSLAFALAALGACAQNDVALEGRKFTLAENAEPAAQMTMSQPISGLVSNSGPTYVTLTVSAIDTQGSVDKAGKHPNAITSGSGFLVDKSGYVLTAAHVAVSDGYMVSARAADGRIYTGVVVDVVPASDMALIKLRGYSGRAVSPTADNCLARGATVFSLGKPHAQGDTARVGQLEAMHFGRAVQYGKFGYPDAMVLRMNTQKGESGGPLFDGSGRLVGMVVSTLTDGTGKPLNLAHAVPATNLAGFLCTHIECSENWRALAQKSTGDCPGV
ncbi:MAG: trypsin-like peptidase domain-containing protein [Rhizobiales bacterium]|nr:trypsin-like peptidase domain-containing protein [Hyphomicrobiales bacterium]